MKKTISKIGTLLRTLSAALFRIVPLKKNTVYFSSFHGQYADNPKYISEKLFELDPTITFIWEIGCKSAEEEVPKYINQVRPNTMKAIFLRSRAKVIIENYAGWSYGYVKKRSLKAWIFRKLKKKSQYGISTWHGTPLKKIAIDEPGKSQSYDSFYSTSDLLIAGCEYTRKILKHITFGQIPVLMYGTPRSDILFFKDEELKERLLHQMHIPSGKKIMLFAPTFRNDIQFSGERQMKDIDIPALLKAAEQRFSGEWVFVFRVHDSVVTSINGDLSNTNCNKFIYSGNVCDDMAQYLYVSDILITDYSSSLFDYALTRKPCFLYCPDIEHYESKERGFYLDIRKMPFPLSYDSSELIRDVRVFDESGYNEGLKTFLNQIGNVEQGRASETIACKVLDVLN